MRTPFADPPLMLRRNPVRCPPFRVSDRKNTPKREHQTYRRTPRAHFYPEGITSSSPGLRRGGATLGTRKTYIPTLERAQRGEQSEHPSPSHPQAEGSRKVPECRNTHCKGASLVASDLHAIEILVRTVNKPSNGLLRSKVWANPCGIVA